MPYDGLFDAISPGSTALLVVDVQRAFASRDSPLVEAGLDLSGPIQTLPKVRRLLEAARDAGLTVAFTRSYRRDDGRDAGDRVHDVLPRINRAGVAICCAGSDDVEFVEGVGPRDGEYEVRKVRYDAFHNTPLEYYLRAEGIETVLVCGFTTNVCVEGTARGAFERGFDVVVVEDCCASYSAAEHEAAVHNVELMLGTTTTLGELAEGFLPIPAD